MPDEEWLPDSGGRQCPECNSVLERPSGVFRVMDRPDPIVRQDGRRARCPKGHDVSAES